MRTPIYGMAIEICIVLIGAILITSCANRQDKIQPDNKSKVVYKFPNILDTMPNLNKTSKNKK